MSLQPPLNMARIRVACDHYQTRTVEFKNRKQLRPPRSVAVVLVSKSIERLGNAGGFYLS